MTALRIDTAKFKEVCQSIRAQIETDFDANDESIYSFYRWFVQDAEKKFLGVAPVNPADRLRGELTVAARTAQQFGATRQQIDYIVSMAVAQNDFNIFSGGRLTKAEANRIISEMEA